MVSEQAILHSIGRIYEVFGKSYDGERLVLPLPDDGASITGFLGFTFYEFSPAGGVDETRPHEIALYPLASD